MNRSLFFACLAAPSVLALAARAAQSQPVFDTTAAAATAADPDSKFIGPIFDQPGDGAIWVHGLTFKAKFDRHGFEYIPFLGSDAPQDYPVDFTIESARVGATELGWQADVEPALDGETVTFHRGAIDEVYVVGPDSIEQNFVVRERRTSGNLHVVVHSASELERADSSLGVAFGNELGGVQVGKASIRDARNRAVHSLTHLVGESIEIQVPQKELESASFPLAIDPLVSTWTVTLISAPTANFPDTSYDVNSNTWLCVDQETFSATDHDVVARQFTPGGTMVNQVFIDASTNDWTRPRVANNLAQRQFMTVAEVNLNTSSSSIQARTYGAVTHALGGVITVAAPNSDGVKFSSPDIGGDDYPVGTPAYCVAYTEGAHATVNTQTHAWASLVSPIGTVLPRVMVNFNNIAVLHISKSDGHWSFGGQRWTIATVWQGVDQNGDSQLITSQVDVSGHVLQDFQFAGPTATDYNSFSVTPLLDESGPIRHFGVASIVPGGGNQYGVFVQGIDASGEPVVGAIGDGVPVAAGSVSLETDGANLYLVHSELAFSKFTHLAQGNIYLDTWSVNLSAGQQQGALTPLQTRVLVAGSTDDESMPSLASMHSSGGGTSNILCIYKRVATLGGGASILAATLY